MTLRHLATGACLVLLVPALAACTSGSPPTGDEGGDARAISVTSTQDACEVSSSQVPAGTLTFDVTNEGSQVTEFYLLGEDGLRIVGEVENIGPQLSRELVVNVPAGTYTTACKPGMRGEGIRADFTVATSDDADVPVSDQATVTQAEDNYATYVQDQSDQLLTRTQEFVELYKAGEDDQARDLYPRARVHWERIETVAESFGDIDPKLDAREADLEEGQQWTGWHRIEKDLWPQDAQDYTPLTDDERATVADDLLETTTALDTRLQDMSFTIDQISNGSIGLLEEVAMGKITGEEEIWSHTDLWDFQANVDGARVAYEGVRPVLLSTDEQLAAELDRRFEALQEDLDRHRTGTGTGTGGFVSYTELSDSDVQALADDVSALSEPLSTLTGAIL